MPTMAPPNPNRQGTGPNTHSAGPNRRRRSNPNRHTPNPNRAKLETIRIVLAGLDSNIDANAREVGHEKMERDKKTGGFFKRMAKSMWQTLAYEKATTTATVEGREDIKKSGNLLHGKGKDDSRWREGVVRRYSSDYGEKLVHQEAGETFHKFNKAEAEQDPAAKRMRTEALELVGGYARGDIATVDDLNDMQERMFEEWRELGLGKDFIGEGEMLAHNITDMALQTKAALDARLGLHQVDERNRLLDEALEEAEFVTGEAKVGSRAEIDATRSERLAKKLQNTPYLRGVGEEKMAVVGSILTNEVVVSGMLSVAFAGLQRGAGAVAATVLPGLGAGIMTAFRERRRLKNEQKLMYRRLDQNEKAETDNKAQAEIAETMYESRSAGEMLAEIGGLYDQNGNLILADRAAVVKAMKIQGEIRARIHLTDRGDRLIDYADNSTEEMEMRRFDLDLAMAKLETDMKDLFANGDPQHGIRAGETFDNMSATHRDIQIGLLKIEMNEKDRLFNKLKLKRSLKRGLITALTATGIGALVRYGYEYAWPAISEFMSNQFGAKPNMEPVGYTDTSAASDMGGIPITPEAPPVPDTIGGGGATEVPATIGGGKAPEVPDVIGAKETPEVPDFLGVKTGPEVPAVLGGKMALQVPDAIAGGKAPEVPSILGGRPDTPEVPDKIGAGETPKVPGAIGAPEGSIGGETFKGGHVVELGKNSKAVLPEGYTLEKNGDQVRITMPNGSTVDTFVDKNGRLSPEAIDILKAKGFNVAPHEETVKGESKVTHEKVTAKEFVANHKEEMVKLQREKWFTQNTSKFDLNELETQNRLLDNGKIRIDVSGMTEGGSFVGNSSLDWSEAAKDGHLYAYLSASKGTQSMAFEVPIGPDGYVDIDPDSPAGALFNKDGEFIGGYQEIAVKGGETPEGKTKIAILSTVVGEKSGKINDVIVTPTKEAATTYTITPTGTTMEPAAVIGNPISAILPPTPITARRNLGEGESVPVTPIVAAPNATPNAANGGGGAGINAAPNTSANTPNTPGGAGGGRTPNAAPRSGGNGVNAAPNRQSNPNTSGSNAQSSPNRATTGRNSQNGAPASSAGGNASPPPRPSPANTGGNAPSGANPNTVGGNPNVANSTPNVIPGNGGPGAWTSRYTYPTSYTSDERDMIDRANRSGGDMPVVFNSLRWPAGMNGTSQKIVNFVLNTLISDVPQRSGESDSDWLARMAGVLRQDTLDDMNALANVPAGFRPYAQEAQEAILAATEPQSATANAAPNNSPIRNTYKPGEYPYPQLFTRDEERIVDDVTKVKVMPSIFSNITFDSNMNAISKGIVMGMLDTLNRTIPRQAGETDDAYRARLIARGRREAEVTLSELSRMTSGIRPYVQEAYESLLVVTEPTSGNGSAPASTSSAASTAAPASATTNP